MFITALRWGLCLSLFLSVMGCRSEVPQISAQAPQNSLLTSNLSREPVEKIKSVENINPMEQGGQVNPLEKEGQIARFLLRVKPAELETPFEGNLSVNAEGYLEVPEASFKVLGGQGEQRITGQVKANALELPVQELGKGPYRLEITLSDEALLTAELEDVLPEETRVLTARHVQIVPVNQSCEGGGCSQVSGNTTIRTGSVQDACVGVVVNCSLHAAEPKKSPEPASDDL